MTGTPFCELQITDDSCFLCGTQAGELTQEHVFPKWLQHRFELWNQKICLLNDTKVQYRNLRIPCCSTCNNEDLSKLEKTISSAVAGGYEACVALDAEIWHLWTAKLFFGILRKELSCLRDRARPDDGPIVSAATLKSFSNLHLFLQGIRGRHAFSGDRPYSVLVCNVHDLGHPRNFSFRDNVVYMTTSIRMGEVAIMVAFEDGGLSVGSYGRYVTAVNGRKLHPLQFDELNAKISYQTSLIDFEIRYISSKVLGERTAIKTAVFGGDRLREWSQEEYSLVLRAHVSKWITSEDEDIDWFTPPNLVPTWMTDVAGELLFQPLPDWQCR